MQAPPSKDGPRINEMIDVRHVRLVGADGEMIGVVEINEALEAADEAGLDLVEVSPNADPPVCKLLDYGRFKYDGEHLQSRWPQSSIMAECIQNYIFGMLSKVVLVEFGRLYGCQS
jgi:translation initiation factor IF-3